MKKLLLVMLLLLVGCSLSNTPTKKAEAFLKKYQSLDKNVLTDLNGVIDGESILVDEQKTKYRDIMKKHYQNLTYEIKEETVDGNDAVVTVEIEVTDFKKILDEANQYLSNHKEEFQDEAGNHSPTKFMDYRLEKMKAAKERVKYTIYLSLTQTNKEWTLNEPDAVTYDKINGIYNY